VLCSALIYAVTGRRWWQLGTLGPKFALTTLAGGSATTLLVLSATPPGAPAAAARSLALVLVGVTLTKLAAEAIVLRHRRGPAGDELARTARLLLGPLVMHTRLRMMLGLAGGVAAPLLWTLAVRHAPGTPGPALLAALLGTVTLIAGELIERWQMFTASSPDRMPGPMR
jgi:formate dehydrogenase iron-sulfur subunit